MTDHDRAALGLRPGEHATVLAKPGAAIKASAALHLSNSALAALGYGVDPHQASATSLSEADFSGSGSA